MKRLLIKVTNSILASIMGLFGFTSCHERGLNKPEYGVPHADYTVKGSVIDEVTEEPIAGIRVGYSPVEWDEDAFGPEPEYHWEPDTYVISSANGGFTLTGSFFNEGKNAILPVYVEDIDGEENGSFQAKKVEVDFKDAVQSGKPDSWYGGEFTVTTNIQLAEVE